METSKTKICKEKKGDRILPNCGKITKCVNIMYNGNIRNNNKENGTQEIFELKNVWNFHQLIIDMKTTDPGNLEDTKENKY